MKDGVLRPMDQGRVFLVKAKGHPLPPRDAAAKLGIGVGRGRSVIDLDVATSTLESRFNPSMGITEWTVEGEVPLINARRLR